MAAACRLDAPRQIPNRNGVSTRKEYHLERRRWYEEGTGEIRKLRRAPRKRCSGQGRRRTSACREDEALRTLVRALAREAAREAFARSNDTRPAKDEVTIH